MIPNDRSDTGSTDRPAQSTEQVRQTRREFDGLRMPATLAPETPMPRTTARITMSLPMYLKLGRGGFRVCFKCGEVAQPLPDSRTDESGVQELRCGARDCGAAAAVELAQAVRGLWLAVTLDGQDVTDRVPR